MQAIFRASVLPLAIAIALSVAAQSDVLTQHNDTDRTGHNPRERVLTPAAVSGGRFGKLFDLSVDGLVYAQPLVVNNVALGDAAPRNILIVATTRNQLYFFDADSGAQLWQRQLSPAPGYSAAVTPQEQWPATGNLYLDLTPNAGIMSTPVVDRATNTLYLTTYSQRTEGPDDFRIDLWAIDLATRNVKYGSPVRIRTPNTFNVVDPRAAALEHRHGALMARHSIEKTPVFQANLQMQRVGLLLAKGRVLLGFGSFGDGGKYHGWVFSYNATKLDDPNDVGIWVSSVISERFDNPAAALWQSGMGLTLDDEQNVFFMTGNGAWAPDNGDYGDSVVKLAIDGKSIRVADWFTPCNQGCLSGNDLDLGSSGVMHMPRTNVIVGGGKQGILYVLDTTSLGRNTPASACPDNPGWGDPACERGTPCMNCANRIKQQFQASCGEITQSGEITGGHIHGSPVYAAYSAGATTIEAIYVWAEEDRLRAFVFDRTAGTFRTTGCQGTNPPWTVGPALSPWYRQPGMTGGMLSVSSNSGRDGIVWATTPTNTDANQRVVTGMLWAYDATNLQRPLWYSYLPCGTAAGQADLSIRDFRRCEPNDVGNYAKFTPPTVANGKVYVPTFSNRISVYGPGAPAPAPIPPNLLGNSGDFEDPTTPWTGTNFAVANDWPHWGLQEGKLTPPFEGTASASYFLPAPRDGRYVLTAWVGSNLRPDYFTAPNAVALSLTTPSGRDSVPIAAYVGYQKYRVEADAKSGERIIINVSVPALTNAPDKMNCSDLQRCPYVILDDVVLTVR